MASLRVATTGSRSILAIAARSVNHIQEPYVYFSKSDDVIELAKFFDGHVFVKMRRVDRLKQLLRMLLHSVLQRNGPKKMVVREQYRKILNISNFLQSLLKISPVQRFNWREEKQNEPRALSNGKLSRRPAGTSGSSKQGSEKKRSSTTM